MMSRVIRSVAIAASCRQPNRPGITNLDSNVKGACGGDTRAAVNSLKAATLKHSHRLQSMAQLRHVMYIRIVFSPIAALGVVLISGCVGEPQTFYAAEPVVLESHTAARASVRPIPAAVAPILTVDEKQRLFQGFQQSQGLKSQAVTNQEPAL